jgi:hypothetical protein
MMKHYAAAVDVWVQCSADYNAAKKTEVIELDPTTTIGELMEHVGKWNLLGCGDVRIVESAQGTQKMQPNT